MNIPEELRYSRDHEWVKVDGGVAIVGITDYAQSQLGDIVFVDVNSEGETLKKGFAFGVIEAVKTVADALMPVSGVVVEVNGDLETAPELLNREPYTKGWIVKVEMTDEEEVNSLMTAEEYKKFIA